MNLHEQLITLRGQRILWKMYSLALLPGNLIEEGLAIVEEDIRGDEQRQIPNLEANFESFIAYFKRFWMKQVSFLKLLAKAFSNASFF